MNLRYFAWVRTRIGKSDETVTASPEIVTVRDLLSHLAARGAGYAAALENARAIRVAVNHAFVTPDHVIADTDEIALFPPVTGG